MAEIMKKLYTENIDRVDHSIHNLKEELNDLNGLEQNVNGQIPQAELKGLKNTVDVKVPETIKYTIQRGDTLSNIIKINVLKYYTKLTEADKENRGLINKISEEIKRQNNMKSDKLTIGTTLEIKTANITTIVNDYLNSAGRNIDTINAKPETIKYTIQRGDTLSNIIKINVLKYYTKLTEADKKNRGLINKISKEIEKQNGVKANELEPGTTLEIKTVNITKIVNDYLKGNNGANNNREGNNGGKIENVQGTINYKVKQGDNFIKIITTEIFNKYYDKKLSSDDKKNQGLLNSIIKEIKVQNNMSSDKLNIGQELKIPMSKIKSIIEKYIKDHEAKIETINGRKYIVLTTLDEFKKGEGLIKRLYCSESNPPHPLDAKIAIQKALKAGEKVLVPTYMEKEDSKVLTLDEITMPNSTKTSKPNLKGKTFVIDPGHGFNDPGAIGLVRHGDAKDKTKVAVFESAIGMDVAYRTAKILRYLGATVKFTHYIPTRGISNKKDLAPCLQYDDKDVQVHQDIRTNKYNEKDKSKNITKGKVSQNTSLNARVSMTNSAETEPNLFISFHMNSEKATNRHNSALIELRDTKLGQSRKFANYLKSQGVVGEIGERGHKGQKDGLLVLNGTTCPSVLLEMGNIQNTQDASKFRTAEGRQARSEKVANAILSYYGNK